jgi:predicted transcriptional regulator
MDWQLFAWLKRGSRRKDVLILLSNSNSPLTANEIKNQLKISLSQSSFTLKELNQKGLIVCLNPLDKIGKVYKISDYGVELLNAL